MPRAAKETYFGGDLFSVDVLVVDDDPGIRSLVRLVMESEGLTVDEAADGRAALSYLRAATPRCVILDVMMPGVDGFGVLAEMSARRIPSETRFVMLTCKSQEKDFLRGWRSGAHEYVTKPFDPDELVGRVSGVLWADPGALADRREQEISRAMLLEQFDRAFAPDGSAHEVRRPGASPRP